MSYGWLTESSLIPKPGKPIEDVPASSLAGLKSLVVEKQDESQKRRAQTRSTRTKATKNFVPKQKRKFLETNEGVEQRNLKDTTTDIHHESAHAFSKQRLAEKAKLYDALCQAPTDEAVETLMTSANIRNSRARLTVDFAVKTTAATQTTSLDASGPSAQTRPRDKLTDLKERLKHMKEKAQLPIPKDGFPAP